VVVQKGLMYGRTTGHYYPRAYVTRAEVSVAVRDLLAYLGKL
jgi:hypothetical protein